LLDAHGAPSSLDATTDVQQLRAELLRRKREVAQATGGAELTTRETDEQINTRDGSQITVRIYQPLDTAAKPGPVLVMLHGGGWILGGLENEQPLCRKFVTEFGGVSFNVDYRLAPEHKFPTAVYDSYDALLWVSGISASTALPC
jgi:acetyl esterase/lipase